MVKNNRLINDKLKIIIEAHKKELDNLKRRNEEYKLALYEKYYDVSQYDNIEYIIELEKKINDYIIKQNKMSLMWREK
jgi:hypothetical protein